MSLSRDSILAAADSHREEIQVPEWGGSVWIRTLSGTERDEYEGSLLGAGGKIAYKDIRAKLLVRAICDADGKRLFSDRDISALGAKSAPALDRVFTAAKRLNAVSDEDVKEIEGNSGPAQSGGAGSE